MIWIIDTKLFNQRKGVLMKILCARFFLISFFIVGTSQTYDQQFLSGKKIVLLYTCPSVERGGSISTGGASEYKLSLFRNLLEAGADVTLFVVDFHNLQQDLLSKGLPYVGMETSSRKNRAEEVYHVLYEFCKKKKVDIIHCNNPFEMTIAKKIAAQIGVSVVATLHGENLHTASCLKGIDGVIGVSSGIIDLLVESNKKLKFGIQHIIWVPPFFNQERLLTFQAVGCKRDFFKETFGITISDDPVVCSIANFYPGCKNHAVLIKAIHLLKYHYNIPTQLMLAGDGKRLPEMRRLAANLGLQSHVHFLGHIDCVPELLFHSDINALTSNNEGFGIALLEGALMKKPLIGTRGTGMENIVIHEKTGLLFVKNNEKDLAMQIKRYIESPHYAMQLASNACVYARNNYSKHVTLGKILTFYVNVLNGQHDKGQ